jgi:hypothetical protein
MRWPREERSPVARLFGVLCVLPGCDDSAARIVSSRCPDRRLGQRHQSGFNGGERPRLLVWARASAANGPEVVRRGWTAGWASLLQLCFLERAGLEGVVEIRRHGSGDGGFSGRRMGRWRPGDCAAPLSRAVMGRVWLGKWPQSLRRPRGD